jgi:hypothetical protein
MSPKCDRRARARVERHLRRMLRATALTGAALGVGTGCGWPGYGEGPPPPEACNYLRVDASWVLRDGGGLVVHVTVPGTGWPASQPAIYGAQLGEVSSGTDLTFEFTPNPDVKVVQAKIRIACNPERVWMLGFDVSVPAQGAKVAFTRLEL